MDDSPTRSDTFIFGHPKASDGNSHSFQVVRPANLKTGFWKILNFFIRHKHNHNKRTHATSSTPTVSSASNPDLILDKKEEEEYGRLCLITDELDESQSLHMEHEKGRDDPDEDKSKSEVSKGFFQKVNLEGLMKLFAELHRKKRARELAKKQDEQPTAESHQQEPTSHKPKEQQHHDKSNQADRVERFLKLSTTLALLKETTVSKASSASILEANAYQQTQTPTNSPRKHTIQRPPEVDLEIDDDTLNLLESVRNKLTDLLLAEESLNSLQGNCNDSTHYNNLCDEDWSTKVAETLDYDTSCEDVSSLKNNSVHDFDEAFLRDAIDSEIVPPLLDCQDDEPPVFSDAIDLDKNIDYMIATCVTDQLNDNDPEQNLSCCDMGNAPNLGEFSYVEISAVGQNIVNTNCDEEQRKDVFLDAVEDQENQGVKEMIYSQISTTIDHILLEQDKHLATETPNNTFVTLTVINDHTIHDNYIYPPFKINFDKTKIAEDIRQDDNTIDDTSEIDNDPNEADLTTINENVELEEEGDEDEMTNDDDDDTTNNDDDQISNAEEPISNAEEATSNAEETISNADEAISNAEETISNAEEPIRNAQERRSSQEFDNIDDLIANYKDKRVFEDEEEIDTMEIEDAEQEEEEPQCRIIEVVTEVDDTSSIDEMSGAAQQAADIEEAAVYNIQEVASNVEEDPRELEGSFKIEDVSSIDETQNVPNADLIDFNDSGITIDEHPKTTDQNPGDHLRSILDQSNEDLSSTATHTPQSAYAIAEEDIKTMIRELLFETEEIKETVIATSSHNLIEESSYCQTIIDEIVNNVTKEAPPCEAPGHVEINLVLDAVIDKVCSLMEMKNHKVVSVNYCFVQTHMEKMKKHPESKIVRANKAFRTLYKVKNACCQIQTGPRVTVVNLTPASQNRCFFKSEDKLTNRIRRSAALLMALYEEMRDYSYYSCTSNILCDLYESMCRNERYLPEIAKRLEIGQESYIAQQHGNVFVVNATGRGGGGANFEKETTEARTVAIGDRELKSGGSTSTASYATCQSVNFAASYTSLNSDSEEELLPVSNILPNLKYTYCSQEEINSVMELGLIEDNVKANEGKDLGLDIPESQSDSSDSLRTDVDINETECFIRVDDGTAVAK